MSADRCPECGYRRDPKWGVIFHRFNCSHNPYNADGQKKRAEGSQRFTPQSEREQDRDARALRTLGAPIPAGCALHGWPGPRLECPTCLEHADRDDFFMEVDRL